MTTVTTSTRRDAERNRGRVLEAAARLFAERGAAATLGDVAREAGVGVGTVYRKFADKDALLDALFDEKIAAMVALADAAGEIEDAGDAFRALLLGLMQKRAVDRGLDAILTSPGRNTRFADELGRRFLPAVEHLVARAIRAGELRAGFSADEVCLLGYMVGTVADITRETDPDLWRRYAQLLLDGTRPQPGIPPLAPLPLTFTDVAACLGRAR
ncbi:TetR/AcrR family transcriptional regulator [Pseudolysinimonas sp.]|jgi:AcrR family transcriptional regulator|uniref:TetR/AcrR family transcriptional regulator n=1 Tax=Pseudolysinimonas sp. TaxID=2680009 RepID=UPI003784E953